MSKRIFILFFICLVITAALNFLSYNIIHFKVRIFNYALFFAISFFITLLVKKKTTSSFLTFCIVFIPFLLIDLTTLIDGNSLIPLRFPFATSFTFLGVITGILFFEHSIYFRVAIGVIAMSYFTVSHYYIIPKIIWSIQSRDHVRSDATLFYQKFNSTIASEIRIIDTIKASTTLVELYFVGCMPCELKYRKLLEIRKSFPADKLNLILICEGGTPYNSFISHAQKNKNAGVIFLYDKEKSLSKHINTLNSFPTELIFSQNKFIASNVGYNEDTEDQYFKTELNLLNKIIYDK